MTTTTASILITYNGQPVALANRRHSTLVADAAQLPAGEPRVRMATWMAVYAKLVLVHQLRGPYTDRDAERFARAALIDSQELLRHACQTDQQLSHRFGVPVEEIAAARAESHARARCRHSNNNGQH